MTCKNTTDLENSGVARSKWLDNDAGGCNLAKIDQHRFDRCIIPSIVITHLLYTLPPSMTHVSYRSMYPEIFPYQCSFAKLNMFN